MTDQFVPAAEVTRGDMTESIHFAAAAVVDHHGALVARLGRVDFVTYSRSSLKPFQALPTVTRGFPERFGLEDRHLAVVCASHSGEERHVNVVREILAAIDATEEHLQCGAHVPLFYRGNEAPVPARKAFSQLHNNCSGKHAGMLALARILGAPLAHYLELQSPVQQLIRAQVSAILEVEIDDLAVAIDGCSAPNYAVSLRALAYGYARLAATAGQELTIGGEWHPPRRVCARVVSAMRAHPEMVSGGGRFDLALARATNGRLFSKAGGEAIECVGIPERGWGVAVKIVDGASRAVGPVVIGILQQLDLLAPAEINALAKFANPVVTNHRGTRVGTIRMIGKLIRERG